MKMEKLWEKYKTAGAFNMQALPESLIKQGQHLLLYPDKEQQSPFRCIVNCRNGQKGREDEKRIKI